MDRTHTFKLVVHGYAKENSSLKQVPSVDDVTRFLATSCPGLYAYDIEIVDPKLKLNSFEVLP